RRPSRRCGAPLTRLTALAGGAPLRRSAPSSSSSGRRSMTPPPGRGAWRGARWISGPAGGARRRPTRRAPAARGPRGPPPPRGGAGRQWGIADGLAGARRTIAAGARPAVAARARAITKGAALGTTAFPRRAVGARLGLDAAAVGRRRRAFRAIGGGRRTVVATR